MYVFFSVGVSGLPTIPLWIRTCNEYQICLINWIVIHYFSDHTHLLFKRLQLTSKMHKDVGGKHNKEIAGLKY